MILGQKNEDGYGSRINVIDDYSRFLHIFKGLWNNEGNLCEYQRCG